MISIVEMEIFPKECIFLKALGNITDKQNLFYVKSSDSLFFLTGPEQQKLTNAKYMRHIKNLLLKFPDLW